MPRTNRYTEGEQRFILKLLEYFRSERDAGKNIMPVTAVQERVSVALGVSLRTVFRVNKYGVTKDVDYKVQKSESSLKKKSGVTKCYENAIRNRVYTMYAAGEQITIFDLLKNINDLDGLDISISALKKALTKLHFKWRKCPSTSTIYLVEKPYFAQKRLQFLREYKLNENSPLPLNPIYLDETFFYSKSSFRNVYKYTTDITAKKKVSEGCRYIVVHAGSQNGFVPNASFIFKSEGKIGHYNQLMTVEAFEDWFEQKLLPNLTEPSLIIMDNASYHSGLVSKIPNVSWTKPALIKWMEDNRVAFPTLGMKDQLWEAVKNHLPPKKYRMDELALQHGHRVLRLPPHHNQYNPMEMVWTDCKNFYETQIRSYGAATKENILTVWDKAFEQLTLQKWKHYCQHTQELINECWDIEKRIDNSNVLPVLMNEDSDVDMSENEESDMEFEGGPSGSKS